jgi:leucyl/phenylalanyl-tRNA--protein transferase
MPVYLLGHDLVFPPPEAAAPEGIVAVGGDVSPERLVLAYSQGIFPWPVRGYPLLWFSPDPRFVLDLGAVHVSRSLRKSVRRGRFEVRFDTSFGEVIAHCAAASRPGQDGTWITPELERGYRKLAELGYAHSIEAFDAGGALVGGLYGVAFGRAFFGESMFSLAPDASKVAFITLLGHLAAQGYRFVDCQVETDHLARFGAENWPRARFLAALREALSHPTEGGRWQARLTPEEALLRLLGDRAGADGE